MEKAYDLKVLVASLKGRGLDIAEDAAGILVEELLNWVMVSAPLSKTPYDDILIAILPIMKSELFKQIDRIDGKVEL